MKTKEQILDYIDSEKQEHTEQIHVTAKDMARGFLEECDGNYDTARTMALSMVMVTKLSYELLTRIQKFEEEAGK